MRSKKQEKEPVSGKTLDAGSFFFFEGNEVTNVIVAQVTDKIDLSISQRRMYRSIPFIYAPPRLNLSAAAAAAGQSDRQRADESSSEHNFFIFLKTSRWPVCIQPAGRIILL